LWHLSYFKMALRLTRPDYQAMLAQLQGAYPLEACGLMAGRAGSVLCL
jgi:hypothetical protein